MYKNIRCRIYPNKHQKNLINQTFGCCRLVYNKALSMREEAYKAGSPIGYRETSAMVTQLKKQDEFSFLKLVEAHALQQSLRDLDRAYVNFFQKRCGHPVYKSKHNHYQSYRTIRNAKMNDIRISRNYLKLPKIGFVKIRISMKIGAIKHVTVSRTPTGKYFATICFEFDPPVLKNHGEKIGIHVGISNFYSDSNKNIVSNPKYLEKSMKKLKREQRKLSRKKKGSNNREKQRIRLALVHEKIVNQRDDFLHKQSTMLIRENQTICVQDLDIESMVQNKIFSRYIASASWGKFFSMLEYKSSWYGNDFLKIPNEYPSAQTCSVCGCKNSNIKNLSIRKWTCPSCGFQHDRGINASINILKYGLQMQSA